MLHCIQNGHTLSFWAYCSWIGLVRTVHLHHHTFGLGRRPNWEGTVFTVTCVGLCHGPKIRWEYMRIPRKGRLEGHLNAEPSRIIQVPFCGSLWILVALLSQSGHNSHDTAATAALWLPLGTRHWDQPPLRCWNIKQLEDVAMKIITWSSPDWWNFM